MPLGSIHPLHSHSVSHHFLPLHIALKGPPCDICSVLPTPPPSPDIQTFSLFLTCNQKPPAPSTLYKQLRLFFFFPFSFLFFLSFLMTIWDGYCRPYLTTYPPISHTQTSSTKTHHSSTSYLSALRSAGFYISHRTIFSRLQERNGTERSPEKKKGRRVVMLRVSEGGWEAVAG